MLRGQEERKYSIMVSPDNIDLDSIDFGIVHTI